MCGRGTTTRRFQLRIQLEDVDPTGVAPAACSRRGELPKLADIFQAAMGWTNSHLHSFTIGDKLYGMHFDEYPEEETRRERHTVSFRCCAAACGASSLNTTSATRGRTRWSSKTYLDATSCSSTGCASTARSACPPEDVGGTRAMRSSSRPSPIPPTKSTTASGLGGLHLRPRRLRPGRRQRRPATGPLISLLSSAWSCASGSSRSRSR